MDVKERIDDFKTLNEMGKSGGVVFFLQLRYSGPIGIYIQIK